MRSLEPRGWQSEALIRWDGQMRGVVEVVTGGGKTIFAQLCMQKFIERYPDGRVLVVVPTAALLDQWVISLVEDFGVAELEIACYSGEERPPKPSRFNVMLINTARNVAKGVSEFGDWMLVVDECHRAGSPENAKALRGSFKATLGLSATPVREYDNGFEEVIRPALGPIIFEYGYKDASRDGIISPFALHNLAVDMLDDEQKAFDRISRSIAVERGRLQRGDGSEERIKILLQRRAAISANATMRIPAAAKLVEKFRGKRTIVFHERKDAADKLASMLKSRRHSVTTYHAGIAPALRRDNLRLYRRGVFDVLVCCKALDEGINVPETSLAVIASSTASTRQRIQRLGRVLRPAPGKTFADIWTIYASVPEEERLTSEAKKYEGVCEITWARVLSPHA